MIQSNYICRPTNSLYWITAGIIGPHIGGILGAWAPNLVLFYEVDNSIDSKEENGGKIEMERTPSSNDDANKPFLVVKE